MIRIAVCDRDSLIREQISREAERISEVYQCEQFLELSEIIDALKNGEEPYQMIWLSLDWELKEKTVASQIQEIGMYAPEARVVYMTAEPLRHIERIFFFSEKPDGFMVKPLNEKILKEHFRLADRENHQELPDMLLVKNRGVMQPVPFHEILYMESTGHLIEIFTRKETYSCYGRLQQFLEKMSCEFIQCHKSYIVNMKAIHRIEGSWIQMADGLKIPISKSRHSETRRNYSCYLSNQTQNRLFLHEKNPNLKS